METLAGRYELEERLGSGGTATVWRALDTRLGVHRAVKVLDVAHGPERDALRERLRVEARAMARVHHPHVVAVHDVGEDGDRDFIVMDLVDGPSLADRVERGGPLPVDEAIRVAVEVLQALGAAHAEGLVHRDVKPGNVLLASTGEARLCDFGIALLEASEQRHTKTGVALGSLPYMAPEQRRDARTVGPPADLYGAGCTLYSALTGANPVDLYLAPGQSPRWASVPPALVPVIRRATAAEPGDRFVDAESMIKALLRADVSEELPEPTMDVALPEHAREMPSPPVGRRSKQVIWLNVVLILFVCLVAYGMVVRARGWVAEALPGRHHAPASDTQVEGAWDGWFAGDSRMDLELVGGNEQLTGELSIRMGSVLRKSRVTGSFDPAAGRLELVDDVAEVRPGTYVAELHASGVMIGEFRPADGDEAVVFSLMRSE